ncbi:hypothetical protein [Paenibacillus xerothermodurans]|uniref:Uncharacterized protein n=1 Tax=Paenibacillus xerothermodurans TaxID=1977292 RepID=A0A2W1N9D6_PAEXE|nr:hypothetical protein [Paenibacillus xerothermodurans]PZE19761.1 hypothetical protein CBW46_016575 [Paenibacillus xerothermodurans]
MLTFEEKIKIIESFPELQRKDVSLGRVNYQYEDSIYEKKNVVYHLHPNGNGYVYAGNLPGYETDSKQLVNIRDYSADQLRTLLAAAIRLLSGDTTPTKESANEAVRASDSNVGLSASHSDHEQWVNPDNETLILTREDELWHLYFGDNLESAFETYEEAEEYLLDEGFQRKG